MANRRKEKKYPSLPWVIRATLENSSMLNCSFGAEEKGRQGRRSCKLSALEASTCDREKLASPQIGLNVTWLIYSGLGTFGLCDGLSPPIGKAVRLGP